MRRTHHSRLRVAMRQCRDPRTTPRCRRGPSSVQHVVDVALVRFDAGADPPPAHSLLFGLRKRKRRGAERIDHLFAGVVRVVDESRQQLLLGDALAGPEADLRLDFPDMRVRVLVDFDCRRHTRRCVSNWVNVSTKSDF